MKLTYLVAVGSISNQSELSHIRPGTTIGASSYPYNNRFIVLEPNLKKESFHHLQVSGQWWEKSRFWLQCIFTHLNLQGKISHNVFFHPVTGRCIHKDFWFTLSKTARTCLRMFGIPRSASVIANGQSGNAGHAIAVKLRGSTYLGCCPHGKFVKIHSMMLLLRIKIRI